MKIRILPILFVLAVFLGTSCSTTREIDVESREVREDGTVIKKERRIDDDGIVIKKRKRDRDILENDEDDRDTEVRIRRNRDKDRDDDDDDDAGIIIKRDN